MIGERMSSHELCETADCNGIPNICQRCERNRIYAAERAAVKKERWRIIRMLHQWSESSWRNGAEREGRAFTVFAKELEAAP